MTEPVLIFGATKISDITIEIFEINNTIVYGILDDDSDKMKTEILDIPVLSNTKDEQYLSLLNNKCTPFFAYENVNNRMKIVNKISSVYSTKSTNAIHPSAKISKSAKIGYGNLICPNVVIGPKVEIGNYCIIKSQSTIEFNTKIDNFVNIGPGTVIDSNVKIKKGVFIGAHASLSKNIEVGTFATVGIGSVVIKDIENEMSIFGNPAKPII